jgi:hypothetical protein
LLLLCKVVISYPRNLAVLDKLKGDQGFPL